MENIKKIVETNIQFQKIHNMKMIEPQIINNMDKDNNKVDSFNFNEIFNIKKIIDSDEDCLNNWINDVDNNTYLNLIKAKKAIMFKTWYEIDNIKRYFYYILFKKSKNINSKIFLSEMDKNINHYIVLYDDWISTVKKLNFIYSDKLTDIAIKSSIKPFEIDNDSSFNSFNGEIIAVYPLKETMYSKNEISSNDKIIKSVALHFIDFSSILNDNGEMEYMSLSKLNKYIGISHSYENYEFLGINPKKELVDLTSPNGYVYREPYIQGFINFIVSPTPIKYYIDDSNGYYKISSLHDDYGNIYNVISDTNLNNLLDYCMYKNQSFRKTIDIGICYHQDSNIELFKPYFFNRKVRFADWNDLVRAHTINDFVKIKPKDDLLSLNLLT